MRIPEFVRMEFLREPTCKNHNKIFPLNPLIAKPERVVAQPMPISRSKTEPSEAGANRTPKCRQHVIQQRNVKTRIMATPISSRGWPPEGPKRMGMPAGTMCGTFMSMAIFRINMT